MLKLNFFIWVFLLMFFSVVQAQDEYTITDEEMEEYYEELKEIEKTLDYKKGIIELQSGNASITVPEGYHFLDQEQSNFVETELRLSSCQDTCYAQGIQPSQYSAATTIHTYYAAEHSLHILSASE